MDNLPKIWYLDVKTLSSEQKQFLRNNIRNVHANSFDNKVATWYGFNDKLETIDNSNGKEQSPLLTFKEFKQYIKQTNMEKKITGYKIKNESNREAISKVFGVGTNDYNGYFMSANSLVHKSAKELGVVELWFTPVYEAIEKTLSIQHSKGTIEIVLKEKGQLYIPSEDTNVPLDVFKKILEPKDIAPVGKIWGIRAYITKFDIGCKKGIDVSEIQRVVKAHDELFA